MKREKAKSSTLARDLRLFGVTLLAIFVAELGDKTQLAALGFAANTPGYRLVVFAAAAGALVMSALLGVLLGDLLARAVKPRTLNLVAGVIFVVCAAMFAYQGFTATQAAPGTPGAPGADPSSGVPVERTPWEVFLFTFGAIFVAELGDKTQLATMSLAAGHRHARWTVFAGAAVALSASAALACLLGGAVGQYIDGRYMKFGAAAIFAALGMAFLAGRAEKGRSQFVWLVGRIEDLYRDQQCRRCPRLMRFLEHVETIGSERVWQKVAELKVPADQWREEDCHHRCEVDELHRKWHERFDHEDETPLLKG
ncbi:MAG: TMEM165/GDT1 family protein [Anaerolineaceae bacterium]|nr:TMEM165/GDT1 family protein [Anaerolineaceae bacterium]